MAKLKNGEAEKLEVAEETAPTIENTQESPKTEKKTAKPERLVYVGPNIPGGILQRFQVYKGGIPPHCLELVEKIPEIRQLFVPVGELPAVRDKLEKSGTNEARLFHIVREKTSRPDREVK